MLDRQLVVAVTGGASGMGLETCRLAARDGAKVAILDRDQAALDAFADELRRQGVSCFAAAVDVRQREQVHDALRQASEMLGPVDVLVTSAGICRASTVDDLKVPQLEEIIGINFLGTVYAIEAVLPQMLERKRGHIVGLASMAGVRGIPYEPAYSASKAAVAAYLESLRRELRPRGIAVTTVFPGYVQTPLLSEINGLMGGDMSNGKAFTAAEAAEKIAKAIKRKSAYAFFPLGLGLSVRASRLLSPRLYDMVMQQMFNHLPISQSGPPKPVADKT